jgi:hypothetical protein
MKKKQFNPKPTGREQAMFYAWLSSDRDPADVMNDRLTESEAIEMAKGASHLSKIIREGVSDDSG